MALAMTKWNKQQQQPLAAVLVVAFVFLSGDSILSTSIQFLFCFILLKCNNSLYAHNPQ